MPKRTDIPLIGALAACASCNAQPAQKMSLHDHRQDILDRMADECGAPRSIFKLIGDDHLQLQPNPGMAYEKVDCALEKVRSSKIPFELGFVGNEAFGNGI